MIIKLICVLHGEKVKVPSENQALLANPTMAIIGMEKAQELIPRILALKPFDYVFSSRLARANDMASAICLALNLDWCTKRYLGQYADV